MSDEITSASLQMTGKAVEVGSLAVQKSIEIIAMLLKELSQAAERRRQRQYEKQNAYITSQFLFRDRKDAAFAVSAEGESASGRILLRA